MTNERRIVITGDEDLIRLAVILTEHGKYRSDRYDLTPPKFAAELQQEIVDVLETPPVRHEEPADLKESSCGDFLSLSTAEVAALVGKSARTILRQPEKYRGVFPCALYESIPCIPCTDSKPQFRGHFFGRLSRAPSRARPVHQPVCPCTPPLPGAG